MGLWSKLTGGETANTTGRTPAERHRREREIRAIDARMVSLSWAEDDPLYLAGAPADHLYVLVEGRVKVVRPTADGNEVITDLIVPGELFGTLGALGEPVYPESAVALTTVCALRMAPEAFRVVLEEHPQVTLRVLDEVAARFERSRASAGRTSSGTVAQRVARTLLHLADKVGQEQRTGATLLQLPLTRTDLAAMAGTTPESVSRVMSGLRADGLIDSGRRWTSILDRARLERLAG
jgi:CRP-like cAMP-binding protein